MKKYIMDVHGFEEENITVLLDDGEHTEPTYENIINAYKTIISEAEEGDAIFLHYSGETDADFDAVSMDTLLQYLHGTGIFNNTGQLTHASSLCIAQTLYRSRYQAS